VAMFGAIFFAYIGLNIGLFLLPWATPDSMGQIVGNERVATEVFRLLIAGLAIAWCVPSAAVCSAWLASRGRGMVFS
ncbi:MAG: YibE/F family protein, partial [Kiritimatiellia bacterium]